MAVGRANHVAGRQAMSLAKGGIWHWWRGGLNFPAEVARGRVDAGRTIIWQADRCKVTRCGAASERIGMSTLTADYDCSFDGFAACL
jgi:hypothetical protein